MRNCYGFLLCAAEGASIPNEFMNQFLQNMSTRSCLQDQGLPFAQMVMPCPWQDFIIQEHTAGPKG